MSASYPSIAALLDARDSLPVEPHVGAWLPVTAERIRMFADATEDHQWIHLDAERATTGPFGAIVAHGFLTLSLLPHLIEGALEVGGCGTRVNYGLDRVRFTHPVRVGERIRAVTRLTAVSPARTGAIATLSIAVEIEERGRPALVAEQLVLLAEEE